MLKEKESSKEQKKLEKRLQTKFNKAILALAALGVAYMYFNEKKNIRLTKEVEELKRMKGE